MNQDSKQENERRPWPDARSFNAMVRAAHLRISQVTFLVPPEPHPSTPLGGLAMTDRERDPDYEEPEVTSEYPLADDPMWDRGEREPYDDDPYQED